MAVNAVLPVRTSLADLLVREEAFVEGLEKRLASNLNEILVYLVQ